MLQRAAVVTILLLALGATCAFAAQTYTVALRPQHGSHEHGKATFAQKGANVIVTISVKQMPHPAAPQFAHLHHGLCGDLGAPVKYELTPIRNGQSSTTLRNLSLATLTSAPYSIAIHQTLAHMSFHIACGGPISGK